MRPARHACFGHALRGTLLGALVLCFICTAFVRADDGWRHDFEQAEKDARDRGLPMVVHFHTSWCGPCRQMEREVFSDPTVAQQLRTSFVAVKIDGDQHPDIVRRFQVGSYPTDLFLDPSGRILDRTEGLRARDVYLGQLARIDARFAQSRKMQIAAQQNARPVTQPATPQRPNLPAEAPNPLAAGKPSEGLANRTPRQPNMPPRNGRRMPLPVGLRGYSPVALIGSRRWVPGNEKYSAEFKGIVYYMTSADEVKQFRSAPERYAPQVLGCDPVILDVTDRAIPGDIRFAAFFDDTVYLFVSDKSRQTFKQDPDRYIRTKHVLKVDDFHDTRLE